MECGQTELRKVNANQLVSYFVRKIVIFVCYSRALEKIAVLL